MKYDTPNNQTEILPNILGLISAKEVFLSEFNGFVDAELIFTESLTKRTKFNIKYINNIHKTALRHLYTFAGKYRDVNLSKGGFPFPAARFLHESMLMFDRDILAKLPNKYDSQTELIKDIATVHGELLFIHPFREGNGRTARILANLMARKQGYHALQFEKISEKEFEFYVAAVQQSAEKRYDRMEQFIASIFPA
jgi:cell filamentation protein